MGKREPIVETAADETEAPRRKRFWGPGLLLIAVGLLGVFWVIPRYGGPNFGNPDVCEGFFFGCQPTRFNATLAVNTTLVFGLVVTALVRRWTPPAFAWRIVAIGLVLTFAATAISWRSEIRTYAVPALSVDEGHQQARSVLAAMRRAAGDATPFTTPRDESRKPRSTPPSPAAVLAGMHESAATDCRDASGKDTRTSAFSWAAQARVIVPTSTLRDVHGVTGPPTEHTAQMRRIAGAVERLGYDVSQRSEDLVSWVFVAEKRPPSPRRAGYSVVEDFGVQVTESVGPAQNPGESIIDIEARVSTPCLRREP